MPKSHKFKYSFFFHLIDGEERHCFWFWEVMRGMNREKTREEILAHYEKKRENIIPMLQGLQREI